MIDSLSPNEMPQGQHSTPTPREPKKPGHMKSRLPWLFLAALVLLALIGTGLFVFRDQLGLQRFEEQEEEQRQEETTEEEQEETSNLATYTNSEYGFAFEYPREWGEARSVLAPCFLDDDENPFTTEIDGEPCYLVFLETTEAGRTYFLSTQTPLYDSHTPPRGGGWMDFAPRITSTGELQNLCDGFGEGNSCAMHTNQHGVGYAKAFADLSIGVEGREVQEEYKEYYYFIYHPDHLFEGIVISSESFEDRFSKEQKEATFDALMESFRFID